MSGFKFSGNGRRLVVSSNGGRDDFDTCGFAVFNDDAGDSMLAEDGQVTVWFLGYGVKVAMCGIFTSTSGRVNPFSPKLVGSNPSQYIRQYKQR